MPELRTPQRALDIAEAFFPRDRYWIGTEDAKDAIRVNVRSVSFNMQCVAEWRAGMTEGHFVETMKGCQESMHDQILSGKVPFRSKG